MKQVKKRQRKNRRIKYNEQVYIEKNYIVDGKAVIPVELEKTDDLFMKHDFKKYELSDEVCDYIEEIAYMIPMNTDIVIELHCPKVDDEMQIKMIKAIKNNYGMDIDDIDYDISKINSRSLIYGIVGILILIINLITEPILGEVLSNFICVVWWVAIWEMVELQTIEKSDAKWKRLNYQQLYDSEITFVFDK
ncbi:MAG: hypothetical protein IJO57_03520 [Bacilli bacterium]|nr:hypothetical protein [Bacilli bacterium]MBQ9854084.1 hypothetical protein [Bacilli bacterium]